MFILSISENILLFISCFGIIQGLLLAGALYFHPKSDRSVTKILALFILCLCIIMAGPLILSLIPWQKAFFLEPFTYLAGPLMYLYIRSYKEKITLQKALPHISLFFLYFFVSFWWVSLLADKYPGAKQIPEEGLRSPVAILFLIVRYSQLLLYYFMSRKELLAYQRSVHHLFSAASPVGMKWGKWLINGYLLVVVVTIILFPLMVRFPEHFSLFYLLNMAIATPYIYLITYKGGTQPTIWQVRPGESNEIAEQISRMEEEQKIVHNKQRIQKTGLCERKITELVSRIILLMDKEKLYQETDLTLNQLAKKLNCPSYHVSQALNDGLKKTFYDFINGYRVEEAKRLLLNPQNRNYTVLSVGFEAGFNSKTTFNTVFKKFTGQTPTDFRQHQSVFLAA